MQKSTLMALLWDQKVDNKVIYVKWWIAMEGDLDDYERGGGKIFR